MANRSGPLVGVVVLLLVLALVRNATGAKDEPKKDQPPAAPRDVVAIVNRGGCGNCHVIPGVPGADGEVGPAQEAHELASFQVAGGSGVLHRDLLRPLAA